MDKANFDGDATVSTCIMAMWARWASTFILRMMLSTLKKFVELLVENRSSKP